MRNVWCSGEMHRYHAELRLRRQHTILQLTLKHESVGIEQATVKLKGIDGGPHKRRNMWFNSMIREEPYPGSNDRGIYKKLYSQQWSLSRCCMVVVSSCREVSA